MMQIRTNSQAWAFRGRAISRIRRAMAFGDAMTSVYTYRTRPSLARVISEQKLGRHCCCCAAELLLLLQRGGRFGGHQLQLSPYSWTRGTIATALAKNIASQVPARQGVIACIGCLLLGIRIICAALITPRVSLTNRYSSHNFWRYRIAILWQS